MKLLLLFILLTGCTTTETVVIVEERIRLVDRETYEAWQTTKLNLIKSRDINEKFRCPSGKSTHWTCNK